MERRKFITGSTLLGLSLTTMPLAGSGFSTKEKAKAPAPSGADDFELNEVTISQLQTQMQQGKLTSYKITQLYLKRIDDIDKNGHALRAVLELNPDVLKEAMELDDERRSGHVRGPMHGIPVLVKDNINTTNMTTTAGSLALEGFKPKEDAFIIKQLRAAGAVILGKTNLSEWANIRSEHSSSGWSSRGGQTKNPYILDRNPVGSSSGSAVAVAANLCVVAVGTETDGSIVAPASGNGVVGLKPTVGLVSRAGIIPISATQDTAGPIARTVQDAAFLLGALTGIDPNDDRTNNSKSKSFTDYTPFLTGATLKGKRIGIEKGWKSTYTDVDKLYHKALDVLTGAGATLIEIELLKEIDKAGDAEFEVLKVELKEGLNRYLATAGAPVKTLAEIIAFNLQNEARVMPFFKQEIFDSAEKTTGLQSKEYIEALAKCRAAVKVIDDLIATNNLDAISGITMGPVCATDLIYGDRFGDANFASPAAIAGYPHITVPCGFTYRLPVGFSFFGKAYSEPQLLGIAHAYEQLTKNRAKPQFFATFE